jgi:hypothetical protein
LHFLQASAARDGPARQLSGPGFYEVSAIAVQQPKVLIVQKSFAQITGDVEAAESHAFKILKIPVSRFRLELDFFRIINFFHRSSKQQRLLNLSADSI